MNNVNLFMHVLLSFRNNANDATMRGIFGETIGNHLWHEFKRYDADVTRWYATLDLKNSRLFHAWLTAKVDELEMGDIDNA